MERIKLNAVMDFMVFNLLALNASLALLLVLGFI